MLQQRKLSQAAGCTLWRLRMDGNRHLGISNKRMPAHCQQSSCNAAQQVMSTDVSISRRTFGHVVAVEADGRQQCRVEALAVLLPQALQQRAGCYSCRVSHLA